jgi:hypothetical protein
MDDSWTNFAGSLFSGKSAWAVASAVAQRESDRSWTISAHLMF